VQETFQVTLQELNQSELKTKVTESALGQAHIWRTDGWYGKKTLTWNWGSNQLFINTH